MQGIPPSAHTRLPRLPLAAADSFLQLCEDWLHHWPQPVPRRPSGRHGHLEPVQVRSSPSHRRCSQSSLPGSLCSRTHALLGSTQSLLQPPCQASLLWEQKAVQSPSLPSPPQGGPAPGVEDRVGPELRMRQPEAKLHMGWDAWGQGAPSRPRAPPALALL